MKAVFFDALIEVWFSKTTDIDTNDEIFSFILTVFFHFDNSV